MAYVWRLPSLVPLATWKPMYLATTWGLRTCSMVIGKWSHLEQKPMNSLITLTLMSMVDGERGAIAMVLDLLVVEVGLGVVRGLSMEVDLRSFSCLR